jgi:chemotaxis protein histidine kinase CheA
MPDKIVHTIHLDRYAPMPAQIQLGTVESYGVEQIAVVAGAGWDGLDIVAVYHPPKAAEPVRVLVPSDGLSDVPPEATASAGRGALVIAGMADGVQIASCNIAYTVIAQAGTDGTTSDAPTPDLVQQILSAANGAVKTADGVRADMDKVLEAESGRKTAEADRAAAESERVTAETARAEAEADRAAAEKERQTAESARIAAENDRQSAETARAKVETARESAETDRATAESARVEAEEERADYERLRRDHETQRVTDETARQTAESKRQEAETARADAESKRADAEQSRVKAESTRVTSETARKDAESERANAEQERQTAEEGRVEAESSRVKAEAEREKQLPALKSSVDELRARQNILVGSDTGNQVSCNDAYSAPLCGLTVYGKSTQDGTPSPDAPVPIVSAGDGGSVEVKVTGKNRMPPNLELGVDVECFVEKNTTIYLVFKGGIVSRGGNLLFIGENNEEMWFAIDEGVTEVHRSLKATAIKFRYYVLDIASKNICLTWDASSPDYEPYREQILTLPTPNGLPGIPVNSGGNYTDQSGQQWVCDEVDFAREVMVQRIDKAALDDTKPLAEQNATLSTPIETPLTPAEIAAYKALTAYGPDTVVQASDGAGIKLDYQRDLNLVVKNLEDAIASMTTT